jgi:mRNA-degrading endonuclease YafQ of YafQ-DinJ toxin-antitoxin module
LNRSVEYSKTLEKKLKKFRSDFPVIDGFKKKMKELETHPNPNQYGQTKKGIWKNCRAEHITKSISFIFRYYPETDTIQVIDLDDHKTLFGEMIEFVLDILNL